MFCQLAITSQFVLHFKSGWVQAYVSVGLSRSFLSYKQEVAYLDIVDPVLIFRRRLYFINGLAMQQ